MLLSNPATQVVCGGGGACHGGAPHFLVLPMSRTRTSLEPKTFGVVLDAANKGIYTGTHTALAART